MEKFKNRFLNPHRRSRREEDMEKLRGPKISLIATGGFKHWAVAL
jgi:hypothetical protein